MEFSDIADFPSELAIGAYPVRIPAALPPVPRRILDFAYVLSANTGIETKRGQDCLFPVPFGAVQLIDTTETVSSDNLHIQLAGEV